MKKDATFSGVGVKALAAGGHVKAAQSAEAGDLDLINEYALVPLKAADVSVYTMQVANDQVDRDGERFTVEVLHDFAASLVGKALLEGHDWGPVGIGRFFKAWVESQNGVTWLMAKAYLLNEDEDAAEMITKLNGGVASFVSVGFYCPDRVQVQDATGAAYGEYRRGPNGEPGEAIEASMVFLGAQYDAAVVKGITDRLTAERAKAHKSAGAWAVVKEFASRLLGKQGRVLSEANLSRLRTALDLSEQSCSMMDKVIASALPVMPEDMPKPMDEPMPMPETAQAIPAPPLVGKSETVEAPAPATTQDKGEDEMTPEQIAALKAELLAGLKVMVDEAMAKVSETFDAKVAEFSAKVAAVEAEQKEIDESVKALAEDTSVEELGSKIIDRIENIELHLGAPRVSEEPAPKTEGEKKPEAKANKGVFGKLIVPAELRA